MWLDVFRTVRSGVSGSDFRPVRPEILQPHSHWPRCLLAFPRVVPAHVLLGSLLCSQPSASLGWAAGVRCRPPQCVEDFARGRGCGSGTCAGDAGTGERAPPDLPSRFYPVAFGFGIQRGVCQLSGNKRASFSELVLGESSFISSTGLLFNPC